jgi:tuberous sclerosis 2
VLKLFLCRALYEEELLDKVLNQLDPAVAKDQDLIVRNASVQLLVELCLECENKRCMEILELIDKVCEKEFV